MSSKTMLGEEWGYIEDYEFLANAFFVNYWFSVTPIFSEKDRI